MLLLRGHPNIIKFYGFFADDEYIYIAMVVLGAWCDVQELAPGGRLFDYIKQRQQFTESDARLALSRLGGGLLPRTLHCAP